MSSINPSNNSIDLCQQYEQLIDLWSRYKQLPSAFSRSIDLYKQLPSVLKKEVEGIKIKEECDTLRKPFENAETMFTLFKTYCFGGEERYAQLPELVLTPDQIDREDHCIVLEPNHLSARIVRGYNPEQETHFVAIKGLVEKIKGGLSAQYKELEECLQIFSQQPLNKLLFGQQPSNKSQWASNSYVSVEINYCIENVLDPFSKKHGGSNKMFKDYHEIFLDTYSPLTTANSLKVFVQAPQIMQLAYQILLEHDVPSVLGKLVMEYYNCEINPFHPLAQTGTN